MKNPIAFIIITLIMWPSVVFSQYQRVENNFKNIKLKQPHLFQLESQFSNENLPIAELELWEPADHINYGYNPVGWAKFSFISETNQSIFLEITSHFIDSVLVLVESDDSMREIKHSSIKHKYFLYEINALKDDLNTVYIRGEVLPGDVLKFGVNLWEPSSFYEYLQKDIWGWALFTGLMLSIFGAVLMINFIKPQIIYIYYGVFIIGITLYSLVNDGWAIYVSKLFSWADSMWFLSVCLNLAIFSFINFTRVFLEGKNVRRKYETGLFIAVNLVILSAQLAIKSLFYLEYGLLTGYLIFWMYYLIESYKSNKIKFRLMLIAISPMILYFLYDVFLQNSGLINQPIEDMLLLRITLIFELTIISLAWLWYNQYTQNLNKELSESNLRLKEKIIKLPEQERNRIASDLHDSLGGTLSALKHRIANKAETSDLITVVDKAITDLKYISLNLQPIELNDGFHQAVAHTIEVLRTLSETPVKLTVYGNVRRFHFENELNLYRIVSELITNVHKHARASLATIQLVYYPDYLLVMVEDNGIGINELRNSNGNGLKNIKERVENINGDLTFTSGDNGTTFMVKSPYQMTEN